MPRRAYAQALLNKIFSCTEALATSGDVNQVFLPPLCPAPYLLLACVCMACMEWRAWCDRTLHAAWAKQRHASPGHVHEKDRKGGRDGRTEGGRE